MMVEREVFGSSVLSNNEEEKRDNSEKESEEESNEEEEENVDADWMNDSEYPPLVSRGVEAVVERGWSSPSWVDTLKKKPRRPVDSKLNGEIQNEKSVASSEGCSRANLLDAKVEIPRDSHVASSEICSTDELVAYMGNGLSASTFSTVEIPIFDDEVLKGKIKLPELQVDERANLGDDIRLQNQESAPKYVKLKQEKVDSHMFISRSVRYALPFDDIDCQEGFEQQMLADEHLKIPKKELDLKHVTIENVEEEMERKVEEEMGVEVEAEKREKRRQKRLRLKERKKAVAVARDGFSLDSTPTQLNQEGVEVGMLKQTETHEGQDEASSSSLNVHQQTELLELVEGNEVASMAQHKAELKEKRRNKKMAKKERKKGTATTTTRDKSMMKWILIIFISLTLLLCLTIMDLQILSQIFHEILYIF